MKLVPDVQLRMKHPALPSRGTSLNEFVKDFPYYVINNVGLTYVLLLRCGLERNRRVRLTGEIYQTVLTT